MRRVYCLTKGCVKTYNMTVHTTGLESALFNQRGSRFRVICAGVVRYSCVQSYDDGGQTIHLIGAAALDL